MFTFSQIDFFFFKKWQGSQSKAGQEEKQHILKE